MTWRRQGIDHVVVASRPHDPDERPPTYYGTLIQGGHEIEACDHVHVRRSDALSCAIELRRAYRAEIDALVARTVTYTHDFAQVELRSDARNGTRARLFETAWPSVDVLARDEHYAGTMRGQPYTMIIRWRPASLRDVLGREGRG